MQISSYTTEKTLFKSRSITVYRAAVSDSPESGSCILKAVDKSAPGSIDGIRSLKREYDYIRRISSPYVIRAADFIAEKQAAAIVLEDIGGAPLKNDIPEGGFSPETFIRLAVSIAEGIAAVHSQSIIHRDINPGNIIWNTETGVLKIVDFSIASAFNIRVSHLGNPEKLEGTLAYISPEQTGRMNRQVDFRTDLYSLGITFYEMLTGRVPFHGRDSMETVYAHLAVAPEPPHKISPSVPEILSDIVMRLTAKNPEERYQSAKGVKHDLEKAAASGFSNFRLGEQDFSGRLQIPEKLYGREKETGQLFNAYRRVSAGTVEMVMVTGFSGTGKTSLVNEIHRPVTENRGYFISGKFDQLQRMVPYSAFTQALGQFCELILSENEDVLARWKARISEAVGGLGKVLTDIVPRLESVIGTQPDVPEAGGEEGQKRLNYVFQHFIRSISTEDHPLVMFIDDLQWADLASLNLLRVLMAGGQHRCLLFIGAYRDNEVSPTHPLMTALEDIREGGMAFDTIPVANLSIENVREWLADTLYTEDTASLADIIYRKTRGNAFFTVRFLQNLYEEHLLYFDTAASRWLWDIDRIEKLDISDNVVSLLIRKIRKFPPEVQNALKLAACIGNVFDLETLSIISAEEKESLEKQIETALVETLVMPIDNENYKFIHDRIHQAAYALIDEEGKKPLHLKIGRLLLEKYDDSESLGQSVFDIVNHLNMGIDLIEEEDEKLTLARLNLKAGQNAKKSAAYKLASDYVQTALRLMPDNRWKRYYDLTISVYNEAIQTSYLCSAYEDMEQFVETVLVQASNMADKTVAYEFLLQSYIMQNKPHLAAESFLGVLNEFGVDIPESPSNQQNMEIINRVRSKLKNMRKDNVINLPHMTDPQKQLALRLFSYGIAGITFTNQELLPYVVSAMVEISLKHGIAPESPFIFTYHTSITNFIGDTRGAYATSEISMALLDKMSSNDIIRARVLCFNSLFGFGWKLHYKEVGRHLMKSYQYALNSGDFEFVGFSLVNNIMYICRTEMLEIVKEKARICEKKMREIGQELTLRALSAEILVVSDLMKQNTSPSFLDNDLKKFTKDFQPGSVIQFESIAIIRKIFLAYLFQKYDNMIEYIQKMEINLKSLATPFVYVKGDYHFYIPLAQLELYTITQAKKERKVYLSKAKESIKNMKKWADFGPVNFLHKYYLLQAELYRVTGRPKDAEIYYDKAVETAYENEYVNEAALANELAAKFYMNSRRPKLAALYFIAARDDYRKWGALAKVKHLEENYPKYLNLYSPASTLGSVTVATGDSISEILDLRSILKASQTLSGEVHLKGLLEKMMAILIENAGAVRGLFIENTGGKLLIQAEAGPDGVTELMKARPAETADHLPLSVVNYAARSKERVVSDNISKEAVYAGDPYIQKHKVKSAACIPALKQGELTALIYLENNRVEGAFTPARLEVLNILSAQIAISVENARLYETLEDKVKQRTRELEATNQALEKSRQTADAANQAKSEFLANMSHEIRTPMNAVLGFTELLDSLVTDKRQRSYVEAIKSGGKSLLTIINDILDLSKIEAGKLDIQYEPVRLRTLLSEVENIFSLKTVRKKLAFTTEVTPDTPDTLVMDEVRVRQILMNLAGNAVKFTEKGSITISAASRKFNPEKQTGDLIIQIKDTGVGIPKSEQAKIFGAFEQRKGQSIRRFGGTGLGLAICKRLLEIMGGEISLESEVGKGSVFTVLLKDLAVADSVESTENKELLPDIIFKKATLLAVDDVEYNLTLFSEYFSGTDIRVIRAENGEKALLFAREYSPDLILMDLGMPVMDGYEATRIIKADEKLRRIPVIAITASSLAKPEDQLKEHPFDGYMRKPISKAALFHELSRFLAYEALGDASDEEEAGVPDEVIPRLPEIIESLEKEFMPVWDGFRTKQPVKEVALFAEGVKALGKTHEVDMLIRFGSDLGEAVQNFDIENMRKMLNVFPKLVDRLKSAEKN